MNAHHDRVAAELARLLLADDSRCLTEASVRAVMVAACGPAWSAYGLRGAMASVFPGAALRMDAATGETGWIGVGWSEAGAAAHVWEALLESEGMPAELPVRDGTVLLTERHEERGEVHALAEYQGDWQAVALRHLDTCAWASIGERDIWERYTDGQSISRIAGAYRGAVYIQTWRIVDRHRRLCGLPRRYKSRNSRNAEATSV